MQISGRDAGRPGQRNFPLPGDIDVVELAAAVDGKLPVGRSTSAQMGDSLYLLRSSWSRYREEKQCSGGIPPAILIPKCLAITRGILLMRVRSDVTHVIVRRTENDFLFETIMYDSASETDTRQAGRWGGGSGY